MAVAPRSPTCKTPSKTPAYIKEVNGTFHIFQTEVDQGKLLKLVYLTLAVSFAFAVNLVLNPAAT